MTPIFRGIHPSSTHQSIYTSVYPWINLHSTHTFNKGTMSLSIRGLPLFFGIYRYCASMHVQCCVLATDPFPTFAGPSACTFSCKHPNTHDAHACTALMHTRQFGLSSSSHWSVVAWHTCCSAPGPAHRMMLRERLHRRHAHRPRSCPYTDLRCAVCTERGVAKSRKRARGSNPFAPKKKTASFFLDD
jgi:hypothetical protein